MSDSSSNTYHSYISSRNPSSTTSLTSLGSSDGDSTSFSHTTKIVSSCHCPMSAKETTKKEYNSPPVLRLFSPGQRTETYVIADAPFVSALQGPCSKKSYEDRRNV